MLVCGLVRNILLESALISATDLKTQYEMVYRHGSRLGLFPDETAVIATNKSSAGIPLLLAQANNGQH